MVICDGVYLYHQCYNWNCDGFDPKRDDYEFDEFESLFDLQIYDDDRWGRVLFDLQIYDDDDIVDAGSFLICRFMMTMTLVRQDPW